MNAGALRAAAAVFVVGLLFVWLIRPIGNACPDVDKLPSGSTASSTPAFAPPLTRTCTYSTLDGTKARKRYVPVLDLVVLLVAAAVVGGGIALARPGPGGSRQARASAPERLPEPSAQDPPAPPPPPLGEEQTEIEIERQAAERERARQERQARRRG